MALSIKQVEDMTGVMQREGETEDSFRLRACASRRLNVNWAHPSADPLCDLDAARFEGHAQAMLATWREKYPEPLKAFTKYRDRVLAAVSDVVELPAGTLREPVDPDLEADAAAPYGTGLAEHSLALRIQQFGRAKRQVGMAPEHGMGYSGWDQVITCKRPDGAAHDPVDNWTPRGTPVEANAGDLFWVVDGDGEVEEAYFTEYMFWTVDGEAEGVNDYAVTHYQPIIKPEAPKC